MMSFATRKWRVSPVAQATTVARKRAIWARDFNHIANVVASAGGADNCNHLGRGCSRAHGSSVGTAEPSSLL